MENPLMVLASGVSITFKTALAYLLIFMYIESRKFKVALYMIAVIPLALGISFTVVAILALLGVIQ